MKTNEHRMICKGFALSERLGHDYAKLTTWLEIQRLNQRATAAWTRGNNSGRPEYRTKMEELSDRLWERACKLAHKQHGWKLSAPGLYWEITDADGHDIRA